MKSLLIILLTTHIGSSAIFAQTRGMSFNEAEKRGISTQKLDDTYQSAVHADSTKSAFKGREDKFLQAYIGFIRGLGSYLSDNGFTWEEPTKCFNRIYFDADGSIDYFLYNFAQGEITKEKERQFKKVLNEFIEEHKFSLAANNKFAQCSPIKYGVKK